MEILAAVGSSLSSLVLTALAFFAVLGIVVFVHEFGHFIVGRLCGIGVTAFSIGFGPSSSDGPTGTARVGSCRRSRSAGT